MSFVAVDISSSQTFNITLSKKKKCLEKNDKTNLFENIKVYPSSMQTEAA